MPGTNESLFRKALNTKDWRSIRTENFAKVLSRYLSGLAKLTSMRQENNSLMSYHKF